MVPCVYILASKPNGILYIGVTSDLHRRMADQGLVAGFAKQHGIKSLVYYEMHELMPAAIQRETQLKFWHRAWKIRLIKSFNPEWLNLYDSATGEIAFSPADRSREKR